LETNPNPGIVSANKGREGSQSPGGILAHIAEGGRFSFPSGKKRNTPLTGGKTRQYLRKVGFLFRKNCSGGVKGRGKEDVIRMYD